MRLISAGDAGTSAGPVLAMKPADTVVLEGASLVLHCAANDPDQSRASPRVVWLRDGSTIDLPYALTNQLLLFVQYNNNNSNAIYIAQIRAQQQMGCRVISVQTERLSA